MPPACAVTAVAIATRGSVRKGVSMCGTKVAKSDWRFPFPRFSDFLVLVVPAKIHVELIAQRAAPVWQLLAKEA